MSPERQQQLNKELSERMTEAIEDYAKKHGLTKEEVMETARSLLLPPQKK